MDIFASLQEASAAHVRGDLIAAKRGYDAILAAEPSHPDALFLLGTLHAQRQEWDRAQAWLRQLLAHHSAHAEGWLNLARVLEQQGQSGEVVDCYDAYLRLRPDDIQAWFNLGLSAFQAKRFEDAERGYRRYLEFVPDSVEANFNLGATLHDAHKLREARHQYERVLQLAPRQMEAYRGLGNIALHERRYADAAAQFTRALEIAPQDVEALSNLGVMLQKLGRLQEAERMLRQAVRIAPDHVNAHFNLGLVLLLQGNFREGWDEYEWRHRIKDRSPVAFAQPEWNGLALDGETILLRAEQGFGDTFQFVRYAPLLKEMGGRVVLECQPGLKRVLLRTPGIDMISERPASGMPLVEFDTHLPLLSLPRLFDTQLDTVPRGLPYIHPEPWLVERWAARLARDDGLRVGIVWAGRPTHEDDKNRSCSLSHFLALADVPGVTLYSLQKGPSTKELEALNPAGQVVDLEPEIDDFADTAAAIANLDLVICVDTSVAHLAGGMGKPVWVVLPFAPDWRWMAEGEGNPWYPTARLFRQQATGDWDSVFERVKGALGAAASQATSPKAPSARALQYDAETTAALRRVRLCLRRAEWGVAEAEALAVLARHPGHTEASWLCGFAQYSLGRPAEALAYLAAAYEAWPQHAPLRKILAMTLQTLDQRPEAEQCYLQALAYGNDDPEVLFNLGVLKHLDGQTEAAIRWYEVASALKPGFPDCLNNLGLALRSQGKSAEAISRFREAVAISPDFFDAVFNLGNALLATGDAAGALDSLQRAVALRGGHAGAHNSLGVALKTLGRVDEAVEAFYRAIELDPALAGAYGNLGNAFKQAGRASEALAAYRAALDRDPHNALAWTNLGSALHQSGAVTEGLAALEQALALAPDLPEAHWNRALAWLARGDYERGWAEYEWGLQAGARPLAPRNIPRWSGQDLGDRGLLISTEQGFGDAIQFVRFVRQARLRAGHVVLECQPELASLLAACAGVDRVVMADTPDAALSGVAARTPLMSLPAILGIKQSDLPGAWPYLAADPARVQDMAARIGTEGLRVGLVWRGSSAHQDDRNRSCPPALLRRLLALSGARFFSLQKDVDAGELAAIGPVQDLAPMLGDFADTAAAVACLDLVLTVDTAVAHLAGAMGKPVWVMLPFVPDWRWGLEGESTPWYPNARLFRQAHPGDWDGVVHGVQRVLDEMLMAKH
jgi:tetratricopeptide (TPR) repeat protein